VNHCWGQNIFVTTGIEQLLQAETGFDYRKTPKFLSDSYSYPFPRLIQGETYQTVHLTCTILGSRDIFLLKFSLCPSDRGKINVYFSV
jgi:hypothetical protein